MSLIADGLMIAAALVSAIYCHVLAGRLRKLRNLDGGVGQAIAALVGQVEEMRTALRATRAAAGESTRTLTERTARAEMAAGRLELLLAALHDHEGASPVNVAARRAGRAGGYGQGVASATPLRAVATARQPDYETSEPEVARGSEEEVDALPAENGVAASATAPESEDIQAPTTTRRLFKIEAIPAEERAAAPPPEAEPEPAAQSADAPRDGVEAATALRKALEALARETSE